MNALFLNTKPLIALHWPAVARLIEPGFETMRGAEYALEDLTEMVKRGSAVAGVFFDDFDRPVLGMVFEHRFYPRKTVINVMALGGSNLAGVASTFWRQFLEWAKESGATEIEACATPAMTRMLADLGFRHTYNVVRMPT